MNNTAPLQFLQAFRHKLLGIFPRRADALFELIDAFLLTLDPRSPVELSLSPAFRRRFFMVYDALRHGQVDPELARQLLATAEPADAIEVAGYAVYVLDSTVHPRLDAETLPDRRKVYSASKESTVAAQPRPWDPKSRRDPQRPLTPGQVRHAWPAFSHGLGTPAQPPRPSGKSPGRSAGFQPTPRPRFPVVSKKQKQAAVASA